MTPLSARQKLVRDLDRSMLDDETAFVLLWTYFEEVGLRNADNRLVKTGRLPGPIGTYPASTEDLSYTTAGGAKWLRSRAREADFDLLALSWLRGLDRLLVKHRGEFEHREITGFDGDAYLVRPLNDWIVRFFDGERSAIPEDSSTSKSRSVTTGRKQGLTLAQYCRNFAAVNVSAREGLKLTVIRDVEWGDPFIRDRLLATRTNGLRFMCWPLNYPLAVDRRPAEGGDFVRVSAPPPTEVRRDELRQAIERARTSQAAILVLPELTVASDDLPALQTLLENNDSAGAEYPILTVAGIEHQAGPGGDINTCVVLSHDGRVLHRHQKVTRYGGVDENSTEWVEGIETGDAVTILESPIGNLTPLICRDLFHEVVGPLVVGTHANILAVPSLSPKTSAHENAAFRFLAANGAATLVCNRWLDQPDSGRPGTFILLPGKSADGKRTLLERLTAAAPALVCSVE